MNDFEKEVIKKLDTIMAYIQLQPKEEKTKTTKHEIPAKTIYWGESSKKEMTWEEAKEWCEKQGGRLPTLIELQQAYADKVEGFVALHYWSATEPSSTLAYLVYFSSGTTLYNNKTYACYVRCIRRQ